MMVVNCGCLKGSPTAVACIPDAKRTMERDALFKATQGTFFVSPQGQIVSVCVNIHARSTKTKRD